MVKKKENMEKNIPKENYVKLAFIYITAIALIIVITYVYKNYQMNKLSEPLIRGHIQEINTEDLDSFLVEVPDATLYFCVSYDRKCRKFEEDIIRVKKKNLFPHQIFYVNLHDKKDINKNFINKFLKKYAYNEKINYNNRPLVIKFNNTKIIKVLYNNKVNLDAVEKLITKDA